MADEEKNENETTEETPEEPQAEEPQAEEPQAEETPAAEEPAPEPEPVAEAAEEPSPTSPAPTSPQRSAGRGGRQVAEETGEPAPEAEPVAEGEPLSADEPAEGAEDAAPAEPARKQKRKRLPRSERHKHSKPKRERPAERRPIVRLPKPEHERGRSQERRGIVVSDAMDKTIVVKVDTVKAHRRYKKVVRRSTKFHAHDEQNAAKIGDLVRIVETRRSRRRRTGASPKCSRRRSSQMIQQESETACGRQHRRPRDPLHPREGRLAPPLRAGRRRDHGDGQDGEPAGRGQEG
jgi:small subunit ribosomal protein S17